jgi:hypothetical protein
MAIPPILTMISTHPAVAAIVIAAGVLLAATMGVVNYLKKISPEAKLE